MIKICTRSVKTIRHFWVEMCTTVRRWKEFYRREVNLWLDGSAVRCRSLLGTQETSVHAPVNRTVRRFCGDRFVQLFVCGN
jgi:hypothetical protein